MATLCGKVEKGGFDCEFVKKPPEAFQSECPVCLQILREPYQAPCCGNSFCRVCIERLKTDNKPCPTCKEVKFTIFHNKGLQRSLCGFQVYCSHKQEGCEWKGELGQLDNHLNLSPQPDKQLEGCGYSEIECIYCSELIKRCNINVHQTDHCPKRPFSCEYCHSYETHYEDVINNHWPVCGYHPVQCPNECGIFPQRQTLENHVTRDCPKTVIDCDFHHVGCDVRLPHKDMPAHLNANLAMHMSLQLAHNSKILTNEILTELQDKMKKLERDNEAFKRDNEVLKHQLQEHSETLKRRLQEINDENHHLQEVVASLQKKVAVSSEKPLNSPVNTLPPEFVFNISEVLWKEDTGDVVQRCSWLSPPFYTHHKGYKLYFSVTISCYVSYEYQEYENVFIELHPHIMRGEYDDHLQWPFNCCIEVMLLNREEFGIEGPEAMSRNYIAYKLLTGDTNPLNVNDDSLTYNFQWYDRGTEQALCFPQCRKEFRFQIAKIISTK